jgi:hypothetical protein
MPQINPSRATTAMTEGTGEQTEANALTAVINEFNGNIDGTNIKQSVAIALGALGITIGTDTNLYRSAANILKTDDALRSADNVQAQAAAATQVEVGSVGGAAGVALGLSADTTLTRTAAGVMRTNGAFSSGGKSIIATSEARSNTAYGTLTTPDQVSVTLPTDGLLEIGYQARWSESVLGAAEAAIFIGSNQLKISDNSGAPVVQSTVQGAPLTGGNLYPLFTTPIGLATLGSATSAVSADVTTGQVVGASQSAGGSLRARFGGTTISLATVGGGPCKVFAAAGTYVVSVQFKASSGSVTAVDRKLWVTPVAFA